MIENEFFPGHLAEPPSPPSPDEHRTESEVLSRGIETIELADARRSIVASVGCNSCGGEALVRYTDGTIEACDCRPRAKESLQSVRGMVANPTGVARDQDNSYSLSQSEFDSMTEALDLE